MSLDKATDVVDVVEQDQLNLSDSIGDTMSADQAVDEAVQEQLVIEDEMLGLGHNRYLESGLPWKGNQTRVNTDMSVSIPGRRVIGSTLPDCAKAIRAMIDDKKVPKRGGNQSNVKFAKWLDQFEPETIAFAGLKAILGEFSANAKGQMKQPYLVNVCRSTFYFLDMQGMHMAIRNESKIYHDRFMENQKTTNTRHMRKALQNARNKLGIEDHGFSNTEQAQIGNLVLDVIRETSGIFNFEFIHINNKKTSWVLTLNEEVISWLENEQERLSWLFPFHMPMVAEPAPWTGPKTGGYLSSDMGITFVSSHNRRQRDTDPNDMPEVTRAVNAIQETKWQINKPVLDVIKQIWENGGGSCKLPPREKLPMPAQPADIDTNEEARKAWRLEAREVANDEAANVTKRVMAAQRLWIADKFSNKDVIYFPHKLDFRGRIYPICTVLSPQGDDMSKGLLQFAEAKPLGESGVKFLKIHIANVFGQDKKSFDDRIQWVDDNHEMLLDSGLYPMDGQRFWQEADGGDNPWQALAACIEYAGYCEHGIEHMSKIPIALDGSCSGLQHYSAILKDKDGGSAVNLVPQDKPADLYSQVKDRTEKKLQEIGEGDKYYECAEAFKGTLTRKIVKRPAMTYCYSVTPMGAADQIRDYLKEIGDNRVKLGFNLGFIVHGAVGEEVGAAKQAMDWLQAAADVFSKANLSVEWTTPTGFRGIQQYMKPTFERVRTYFGENKMQLSSFLKTDKVDKNKASNSVAPNFIHSLDGSHLQRTVNACKQQAGIDAFAMVHDSFGVHACHAEDMARILREEFVTMYNEYDLETLRAEFVERLNQSGNPDLVAELPECPVKGDLDLNDVMCADYFFS